MASKSLGTLTLDLVAKIGGYVGPLDKAERRTKQNTDKIKGYAKSVGVAFAAMGGAAAAGLAVLVRQSINTADQMSKTSKIVGVAIEDLSGLRHAADLSGVSFEELSGGLNRFNRSNSDALEGIGAGAEAYKALRIEIKRTDGSIKDNYELIGEVADAFAGMQDGAVKSALAQDLFGRSGAKLIPLLNGGKDGMKAMADEAKRLGLVIDQDTGTASEEFNDNLRRLQLVMVGVGYTITKDVARPLADFTAVLADPETQKGLADIATGIVTIGTAAVEAVTALTTFGRVLGEEIAKITGGIDLFDLNSVDDQIEQIENMLRGDESKLRFFGKDGYVKYYDEAELQQELKKLVAQRDEILKSSRGQELVSLSGGSSGKQESPTKSWDEFGFMTDVTKLVEDRGKAVGQLNKQVESQIATYQEQLALTGDVTELERIRYAITSGALVGINDQQQQRLEGLAAEIDAIQSAQKAEEERATAELKLAADFESVRSTLLTQEEALLEASKARYETIEEAFTAGIIGEQAFAELATRNTELLGEQIDALKGKIDEMDEFTKEAARSIQSELSDALMAGFDGGSDDMLKRWGEMLKRMLADAVAADLTRALFGQGDATGGSSNTGQMITGIASLFAGFYDTGGSIPGGKFGIVGERGPELVAGPATVTGRRDTAAMMGGRSVSIGNLIFPGVTNAREAEVAAGAAGRKISSIVASSARYG